MEKQPFILEPMMGMQGLLSLQWFCIVL